MTGRPEIATDTIPSIEGLYDVIYRRRDTRREFTGDPVSADMLERVLSAAHAARQSDVAAMDFVLVRSPETLAAFRDHVADERDVFASPLNGERREFFPESRSKASASPGSEL